MRSAYGRAPSPRFRLRRATPAPGSGQAGITMVEMLIAFLISSILLVGVFAMLWLTVERRNPTTESNQQDAGVSQLRTRLIRDWSRSMIIRTNLTPVGGVVEDECIGGLSSNLSPSITTIIAMQTNTEPFIANLSERLTPAQQLPRLNRRRIIYNLVPTDFRSGLDERDTWASQNGQAGTFDVVRRVCETTNPPGSDQAVQNCDPTKGPHPWIEQQDEGCWRRNEQRIWNGFLPNNNDPLGAPFWGGDQEILAQGVRGVTVTQCNNPPATWDGSPGGAPKYVPCDGSVTITGVDGKAVTLRLRQQTWRPT